MREGKRWGGGVENKGGKEDGGRGGRGNGVGEGRRKVGG